ncbi:tetratricopeptide repeat protein [Methylobacterium sp. WL2]|uniref:tetratricopeptide repeat protein n=2 Tax=unclassified Methylobacterium TaxID=2615210 RepID=UPI0011C8CE1E|nr:tetratricopeptide repeat protein [Methylobacterium sp. WL2]TXN57560.1 tetratricopeptide repeat protein [Methylobacterium sp. WL2]
MGSGGNRSGICGYLGTRLLRVSLPVLALLAAIEPALAARLIVAKGSEAGSGPGGYGRIVLTFDRPVTVKAKLAGGILLLGYGERVTPGPERIAEEMPAFVSMVRRDPDGSGLRVALQRPYQANVQLAGERVFVDLLPEGWSGLPPPLPPEVVAELARRARVAEEALKARMLPPARKALALELARLPTLTRLSLRLPDEAVATVSAEGPTTRLRVAGSWTIDSNEARGRPRPGIAKLATESDASSASILLTPAEGYTVTTEREDGAYTIDVVSRTPLKAPESKAAEVPGPADAGAAKPVVPVPQPTRKAEAPATPDAAPEAPPTRKAGSGLVFPFTTLPPAALFERGGVATLVFETAEPVTAPAGNQGLAPVGAPTRTGPVTVLRFRVPPGRLVDLAAVTTGTGSAWELSAGDTLSPSDTLDPVRKPDPSGRITVSLALPRPGSATWLDLDGERIAVVASAAQRAIGNPKSRRFVDFEILPSRHGLAVLASADDLAVRPQLDAVTIGREGGLAASTAARKPDPALAEAGTLAVAREPWEQARIGNVRETLRTLAGTAAMVPPAERGPARLALARANIANGFDLEGLAALEAAAAEDPLLATQRDVAILRGLALVRSGRNAEALKALSGPRLASDPEAALWRAMASAGLGDWKAAETGFPNALPVADGYPTDLAQQIRAQAAEAAIENGDAETAAARAEDAAHLPRWIRDRLALVRARVSEATGQADAALDAYARLEQVGQRPVAAEAQLRSTLLARAAGKIEPDAAIERLERLALTWHGGPTETGIAVGLARLYLDAGRWRDAFAALRRANAIAPNDPATQALSREVRTAFENLYLTDKGDRLTGIEAVALYFDFRELAPIGRRGDEVVRRLADRLVGLDLLDSAADLLQYQIDNRLTGPARSAVAARLATIRLMDDKPMRALQALDATNLPELPGELKRARALVRARALSDLTRTDLALETIEDESGPDIERLRADIYWGARRWREAGESHESLLGDAWRAGRPLDVQARADAVRAAIAYDLAGEAIGLERLKAKFSEAMAESPDARTFALLTGANPTKTPEFRGIAARATKADTLSAFLAEYRKRYPETALPERGAAAGERQTSAEARGAPPG